MEGRKKERKKERRKERKKERKKKKKERKKERKKKGKEKKRKKEIPTSISCANKRIKAVTRDDVLRFVVRYHNTLLDFLFLTITF